jgi:hypothetical protein
MSVRNNTPTNDISQQNQCLAKLHNMMMAKRNKLIMRRVQLIITKLYGFGLLRRRRIYSVEARHVGKGLDTGTRISSMLILLTVTVK